MAGMDGRAKTALPNRPDGLAAKTMIHTSQGILAVKQNPSRTLAHADRATFSLNATMRGSSI